MNRQNEIRLGTLPTYVRKARPRPNFTIRGDSLVDKVLFTGDRASGVQLADGTRIDARLVIVCGGTLVSPAILQRSGIGPADDLRALGIDVVSDLPVGHGMRDHPMCMFHIETPPEIAQLAGPGFTVAARGPNFFSFPTAWDEVEGVCNITIALNRQEPEGSVRLSSTDPNVQPRIDCGFDGIIERGDMEGPWAVFQQLMRTDAFGSRGITGGDSIRPYEEVVNERVGLSFHMSSTCPIGPVLDPRLRVKGVKGLMVADASVFPENMENNLNMTCYMVGERCADLAAEELGTASTA
jgi:choline dehydrogenase